MRFAAKDHCGEAAAIVRALVDAGHEPTVDCPCDLFLIDLDPDCYGYRDVISFYSEEGAVVLQYPHGAGANLGYDALYEPYELVDGQLTVGPGEVEYLRRLGISRPARPIGWAYCRQLPFRRCSNPKNVVFAPIHLNGDGSILDYRREKNAEVFRALLDGGWDLTVRWIGDLEATGLYWHPGVRYVQGAMDLSTAEIDGADVVVAGNGTYPTLAVARGCPTVVYDQLSTAMGLANEPRVTLRRPELYSDVVRYPFDFDDAPLDQLIRAAATNDATIAQWKADWVGEPFDGLAVAAMIEEWVPELLSRRVLA